MDCPKTIFNHTAYTRNMQPITLNFHGKSVRLLTLLEQLKTLPLISVGHEELNPELTFANRTRAVDDSEEEVSVYLHDGKYIVLTGRKVIDNAWAENVTTFNARLVSKHALKHLQSMGENTKVILRQQSSSQQQRV